MFEAAARSKRDLEFHLLGELPGYHKVDFPCVLYHGPYERGACPATCRRFHRATPLFVPFGPETYCHTLTEAWLSGLPVLASDIGVVAERVKRHGGGRLVEPHRPELWLEALDELRCKKTWHSLHDQVSAIGIRGVSDMAREYEELYRKHALPRLNLRPARDHVHGLYYNLLRSAAKNRKKSCVRGLAVNARVSDGVQSKEGDG